MTTSTPGRRHGWIDLIQTSGPFLTVPVADATWPAGIPAVPADARAKVRAAVTELLADGGVSQRDVIQLVLTDVLGWSDALQEGPEIPTALTEVVGEHAATVRPDFAFHAEPDDEPMVEPDVDDELDDDTADDDDSSPATAAAVLSDNPWRLLGLRTRWGTHPLTRTMQAGWAASAVERLAALLRARDIPIGIVTGGRWWAIVWAPRGKPVGAAVWDASLWSEEPESLAAFVALLERRRFLGVAPADRLPALLARSAEAQEEVTTALGAQVRTAVEMLVHRFDDLDLQADGEILRDVSDDDVYAGIVTMMMRIVFLLFAEERLLLPSDDDRYDRGYSVGRLVDQLRQRASLHGEQTLEHRTGAWHRLLAVTRALHSGVHHEDLRLPAYGGGLFDPDRYPWLEGRGENTPPVDDLTVLHMLEAVQFVTLKRESRRLSFRTLDVEQIGYVYEGLLELEVRTATEPILFLRPVPDGVDFVVASTAVEITQDLHEWTASTYLGKRKATPATRKRADRLLAIDVPPTTAIALRSGLEEALAEKIVALSPLLRVDERDRPLITPAGGRYVASSTRRASTGAHYTPRSLAEEVVQHTLEPLVYRPGPLETLDRTTWQLRPSAEIEKLRVADIAMGSGAFLVAACRFLADRWVEARDAEGDRSASRSLQDRTEGAADAEVDDVLLAARRVIAEHCLYGVDINPLAVEMAKLSLWLITMDRERPFGFLDDRLVCGDSLLGIASMDQLETLHLDPIAGRTLRVGSLDFGDDWRTALARAADTRRRITATSVTTIRDVEYKSRLLREAEQAAAPLNLVADALTGAGLQAAGLSVARRRAIFVELESGVWADESQRNRKILDRYAAELQGGLPSGREARHPLHWPLAFPEVFADTNQPGFDAIIGNPPFLGGQKISGALGADYLAWLQAWDGVGTRGSADLSARFLLRATRILRAHGQLGFVTTNTLIEGDTLGVGLLQAASSGWLLRRGTSSHKWPSATASLSIVEVWLSRVTKRVPAVLDGEPVPQLGSDLQPYLSETGRPEHLNANADVAYIGFYVLGLGFTLEPSEAEHMIAIDPRNRDVIRPYYAGADLNQRSDISPSRRVINFSKMSAAAAATYSLPFKRIEERVKPERLRNNRENYRELWWQYAELRPGLLAALDTREHVLALSRHGSVVLPVRVPSNAVYSEGCVVFALEEFSDLAMLSSSAHQLWAIRYSSTLETRVRYAPSDAFMTWPRPKPSGDLDQLGHQLDAERREVMLSRSLGLTKFYNQVHDPVVTDIAVVKVREIHRQIDEAMLAGYGWSDLDLQIGHHPTKIGIRWTVSPEARFELLDRLLIENHKTGTRAIRLNAGNRRNLQLRSTRLQREQQGEGP